MKALLLKLTSAITMDGEVVKAGAVIEVTEREAKNLLGRGKAVLNEDQLPEEVDITTLSKPDLAEMAAELEIEGYDKMTKDQLITAINATRGDE